MREYAGEPKREPVELERVYDAEVVEDRPEWELLVSEWANAASQVLIGQLRQARAAAMVQRHYGRASVEKFANEVGCSRSTAYDYARAWSIFGHLYFSEDGQPSGRLDNSGVIGIGHLIEASYSPDPVEVLERAEDEGMTTRQIKAERKDEGKERAQKTETKVCPRCGGDGRIPLINGGNS